MARLNCLMHICWTLQPGLWDDWRPVARAGFIGGVLGSLRCAQQQPSCLWWGRTQFRMRTSTGHGGVMRFSGCV